MTPTEHTTQQRDPRNRSPQPETDREAMEPAENAGTPEAVKAAKTRHRAEGTKTAQEARRVQGVEWVRPTDLLARQSATVAGRGMGLMSVQLTLVRRFYGTDWEDMNHGKVLRRVQEGRGRSGAAGCNTTGSGA